MRTYIIILMYNKKCFQSIKKWPKHLGSLLHDWNFKISVFARPLNIFSNTWQRLFSLSWQTLNNKRKSILNHAFKLGSTLKEFFINLVFGIRIQSLILHQVLTFPKTQESIFSKQIQKYLGYGSNIYQRPFSIWFITLDIKILCNLG